MEQHWKRIEISNSSIKIIAKAIILKINVVFYSDNITVVVKKGVNHIQYAITVSSEDVLFFRASPGWRAIEQCRTSGGLGDLMMLFSCAGVHYWRVFPAKLEGWAFTFQRTHGHSASQQPAGKQHLDTRHFLPEWKEVHSPQHDHPQQAAAPAGRWVLALHHEVRDLQQYYNRSIDRIYLSI